jgi:hypothetical protein
MVEASGLALLTVVALTVVFAGIAYVIARAIERLTR